jgi:hypothetical protein
MPDSSTYPHLYDPPPCSAWPANLLHVVGSTFRDAAGHGLDTWRCMDLTRVACLAAGGTQDDDLQTITRMIASLSKERGDWLWGPMDAWWAANRPAPPNIPDPFEEDMA